MVAVDAGAEDVAEDGDVLEVVTGPTDLAAVRGALEQAGVEVQSAELVMRPTNRIEIEESQAASLMRLLDTLEDNDDVQAVHANFDVDADVLERVLAN
jgi:transcriptional/translational regulatory protein YebC/TACO1